MRGTYSELNKVRIYVNEWQNSIFFHPLTCGNDSNHEILYPKIDLISKTEDLFELTLYCKECNWKQDVPPYFKPNKE
jgi:hypothetical protein